MEQAKDMNESKPTRSLNLVDLEKSKTRKVRTYFLWALFALVVFTAVGIFYGLFDDGNPTDQEIVGPYRNHLMR